MLNALVAFGAFGKWEDLNCAGSWLQYAACFPVPCRKAWPAADWKSRVNLPKYHAHPGRFSSCLSIPAPSLGRSLTAQAKANRTSVVGLEVVRRQC